MKMMRITSAGPGPKNPRTDSMLFSFKLVPLIVK